MAEIRKHNPDDAEGLGKLVRDALGERIRPTEPGRTPSAAEDREAEGRDDAPASSASALPSWPSDGPGYTF